MIRTRPDLKGRHKRMTLTIELDPEVEARLRTKAALRHLPFEEYVRNLVLADREPLPFPEVAELYARGEITQGEAALLAGMTRSDLLQALSAHGITPYQYENAEELLKE